MGWTREELHRRGYRPDGKGGMIRIVPETGAKMYPTLTDVYMYEATLPLTAEEKLNKTEKAFLQELRCFMHPGRKIGIQDITLKLGDDCRYTPDFSVWVQCDASGIGRLFVYETKGFWRDDARVKIKTGARMYPWIVFTAVQKRSGGGWSYETINQ